MLQLISLLVENKPGALLRVARTALPPAVTTLKMSSPPSPVRMDAELSRMSIVVDVEPSQRAQVIKQMNKLINVLQVSDLTEAPAVPPRIGSDPRSAPTAQNRAISHP